MDLELLMFYFLIGPVAAIFAFSLLFMISWLLYLMFKRVYKMFGRDQCDSYFGTRMKIFRKPVTHSLVHPEVMLLKCIKIPEAENVKTVLCQHLNDSSKDGNKKTTEVITIKEDKVKDGPKLQADTDYWVSTIPVAYYATLFTVYFWPRMVHAMIYETSFNGFMICIAISYFIFCYFFAAHIQAQNTIPTNNHLSETEALAYLTGPMDCNAYVNIEYYHMKNYGQYSSKVITNSKVIKIPVTQWTDTTAPPCKDILSGDISKLFSKTPFFLVSAVLQSKPADEESKKCLEQFKHRDPMSSVSFSYKLMKNGKDVAELVVFRDSASVPQYWLGLEYFCLVFMAIIVVVPLPALLLLMWKLVRRKMIFMKTIRPSMAVPGSNYIFP
eukprot:GFUD01038438.1.p1 GENE.GFUD01038438.1~~GFUD01038438.1.p1  ORF type:complete len:392 (-),score=47.75 GFUD01038438.1:206-1357(-)